MEGLAALLRAEGHDPVALLCVRHDPARYTELEELVRPRRRRPTSSCPGSRDRIAPLLRHFAPDLALCLGFPWKIPPEALAVPRHGIVNGHPSLLPRYRGPSPVAWAIRNGENEVGFTFHYMDAELDTGNILAQERVPLGDEHGWEELDAEARDRGRQPPARVFSSGSSGATPANRRTRARQATSDCSSPSTHGSTGRALWTRSRVKYARGASSRGARTIVGPLGRSTAKPCASVA